MREWITLVEGTLNISEDTERLDERSRTEVDVRGKEVVVMTNPIRAAILRAGTDLNRGWMRGFLLADGSVRVFDAHSATHYDIGLALDLHGKRFEIRTDKDDTERSTMLYLPRADYANAAEWRKEPMIARMFPEGFHIGPLRS